MQISVLPELVSSEPVAHVVTLYDWQPKAMPDWLELVDQLFAEFGHVPDSATAHFGGKTSHGKLNRTRRRIESFLKAGTPQDTFDFRLTGEATRPEDGHFPCEIVFAASGTSKRTRKMVLAVRELADDSIRQLCERVALNLVRELGVCYGGVFEFPARFGPESYLSGVKAVPRGVNVMANHDYGERLSRWSNRMSSEDIRYSDGFFREIYSVNFVSGGHLDRVFQDTVLSEVMKNHGSVSQIEPMPDQYLWSVPDNKLAQVRELMEPAGFVVSSPYSLVT